MKGSTYQRKDGRWVGVVDIGTDPNGKRLKKYIYGKKEREVRLKLNEVIYELQNQTFVNPENIKFVDFIQEYHNLAKKNWQTTTADLYQLYIDVHIKPYFKNKKLSDILPITLDKYNSHLLESLSANTVLKINSLISGTLDYAVINKKIKQNPAKLTIKIKKKRFKPNVYNEENFNNLMNVITGTKLEIPVLLAAGCGLRRGEVFGIEWKNVDLNNRTIKIEKTLVRQRSGYTEKDPKNDFSARTIFIPASVNDSLKKLYNSYADKPNPSDKVIDWYKPNTVSQNFKKALEDNNLPLIRYHDLRHFNAVVMMRAGVPDKVASERLGHSNVVTLKKVYQHVLTDMDDSAAEKIDAAINLKN